jgi:protein-S-isoprenylcysteine O-methyltransferase Ste14
VALAVAVFAPAWTLAYWQAWLYLAVFTTSCIAVTLYLMRHDPQLLERRIIAGPPAEKRASQRRIVALASVAFIAIPVVSALDHRFGWSSVPPAASFCGDALVAAGFAIIFLVFRENTFASAVIDVEVGQDVVSTGPYALVRHPMYAGGILLLLGEPPALGSWWGLLAVIPIAAALVWRLLDEERFLATNLHNYVEYCKHVRHRLVPRVW